MEGNRCEHIALDRGAAQEPFHYVLPKEKIAQRPVGSGEKRAQAQLLAASGAGHGQSPMLSPCSIQDILFSELPALLAPGDLVVLNDSKVVPSRFFTRLEGTGREVEIFLLGKLAPATPSAQYDCPQGECYEALGHPLEKLRAGLELKLSGKLRGVVLGRTNDARRLVLRLQPIEPNCTTAVEDLIRESALMPIPPYIREGRADEFDREDYQTVYAKIAGSVAAPTAGLHFTAQLLNELRVRGIETAYLTLHVGMASFLPAKQQDPELQQTAQERFLIPDDTWQLIKRAKKNGKRVVAIGTTTVRALESFMLRDSQSVIRDEDSGMFSTTLFIRPGFKFQVIDGLVTNFHHPGSTHLFLVEAFVGRAALEAIYTHALGHEYKFLSYGDAMISLEPAI